MSSGRYTLRIMQSPDASFFSGRDGVRLAYREIGEGRPRVLLHGFTEDPVALIHVLDSIAATPVEPLGRVRVPTLVAVGSDDERAASADDLVAAIADYLADRDHPA